MSLSSHANVYNTCLRILRSRGFDLRVEGELTAGDTGYPSQLAWIANQGEFNFQADNPIELLGLVAIHDAVKPATNNPYWWVVEGPDILSELLERAFPEPGGADQI